jgi:hypothetical protein
LKRSFHVAICSAKWASSGRSRWSTSMPVPAMMKSANARPCGVREDKPVGIDDVR